MVRESHLREGTYRQCANPFVHAVVSAPVVGATSLEKLKDLIGRPWIPSQLFKVSDSVEYRCSRYQTF
jgi:hypothetical protein